MDITKILNEHKHSPEDMMQELFPIIYEELYKIARKNIAASWSVDTVSATALVNEAYLKMVDQKQCHANNKSHFLAIAAKAMKHVIINYAEQKKALKRGGEMQQVTLDSQADNVLQSSDQGLEVLTMVNKALDRLEEVDPELAHIFELKYYAGLNDQDIAQILSVTDRTIRRKWKQAKALLASFL